MEGEKSFTVSSMFNAYHTFGLELQFAADEQNAIRRSIEYKSEQLERYAFYSIDENLK